MTTWLLWLALAAADPGVEAPLQEAWQAARTEATWRSPYAAERSALRDAVARLAADAASCTEETLADARRLLEPADFTLEVLGEGEDRILLLREARERRGAGLVAIRCGEADDRVWQAPHAFFDLQTGAIVRRIFAETDARAAMWNTIHRYRAMPGERPEDPVNPADVTRETGSLFHAATVGLAVGNPDLRFLQVHGFAQDLDLEGVVSTGNAEDPPTAVAQALTPVIGPTGAFGADTDRLGATRNVQGQMLAEFPGRRFLHLELSREIRASLTADADLRRALVEALGEAGW